MAKKPKTIEETYKKLSQLDHILLRPDTYVGSVEREHSMKWVLNEAGTMFEYADIEYVPALYKIFDEVLVNASDNYQRDSKAMTWLKVEINEKQGFIEVANNGKGIPVAMHNEHNIYVPHLIFGHLLTGANYDDDEKKVVGGKNGYGAKLANIFSTRFDVQCADEENRKLFKMSWSNNMRAHSEPNISFHSGKSHTLIRFYPDFVRFSMKAFEPNTIKLLKKRVFDMAGTLPKLKVSLNHVEIKLSSFSAYVDMYLKEPGTNSSDVLKIFDKSVNNDRWEVIISLSDGQFRQVSFVNGICTTKGGTHVNYITDQLVEKVQELIAKKAGKKDELTIKPHQIKAKLWVFINCLIINPTFDSQTKENMTTKPSNFGSDCTLSDKMIKQIRESKVVEQLIEEAKARERTKLSKAIGGKKTSKVTGVDKLEDANEAGKRNSDKCTLILTEGDSAKSLAVAGLAVVGRDYYGVFPLRGKLLNVRQASNKTLMDNQEVQNIMKIMGLQIGQEYTDVKKLRYGSIMIMADQDIDGSHIKGLVINFIHFFWPSLFKLRGFMKEFITPLLKATKGSQVKAFYIIQDFKNWAANIPDLKSWKIKYYKGLGTSTDKEAQQYFTNIRQNRLEFTYQNEQDDKALDLVFNKKKAQDRKRWLETYDANNTFVYNRQHIRYKEFVDMELIHFSHTDNHRSICSMMDGLKPGTRKVLFGCFKRNLKEQVKVSQLAGYVAEHSAYHHGEMSLTGTIVGLAQNYVGSNNINLLVPAGQFGTRAQGGKNSASPRYIFTKLSKITRHIFKEADDHILNYLEDDGQRVEPDYYLPIIPMTLVNGCSGIGSGWSTNIPNFNPRELCTAIMAKLEGKQGRPLHPWYKGFEGTIEIKSQGVYSNRGNIEIEEQSGKLHITELPVGKWTKDYKHFLEKKLEQEEIEDIRQLHTNTRVHFQITVSQERMAKIQSRLHKEFSLSSQINITNMVAFDPQGHLRRYETPEQIMSQFFEQRLKYYSKRKQYLVSRLRRETEILDMKAKFVTAVVDGTLKITNVKKKILQQNLAAAGYTKFSKLPKVLSTKPVFNQKKKKNNDGDQQGSGDESEGEKEPEKEVQKKEYDYLLSLSIQSLTYEKVEDFKQKAVEKRNELKILMATRQEDMWKEDLENFLKVLEEVETQEKSKEDKIVAEDKGKKRRKKVVKVVDTDSETQDAPKKKNKKNKGGDTSDTDEEKGKQSSSKKIEEQSTEKPKKAGRGKKKKEASQLFDQKQQSVFSKKSKDSDGEVDVIRPVLQRKKVSMAEVEIDEDSDSEVRFRRQIRDGRRKNKKGEDSQWMGD